MQTPAEIYLIQRVSEILKEDYNAEPKILNIGAGRSTIIESSISNMIGNKFTCDRMDVSDCYANHPVIGECFLTSVESMPEIGSRRYDLAFANYVLEHVTHLNKAASEIHRILKESGCFVTSIPNPSAPEFTLSKYTSTKFHQFVKGNSEGCQAHETCYAFKNIEDFASIFEKYFSAIEIRYWSNTLGYLYKFPVTNILSRAYDRMINYLNIRTLMGDACIVFKKNGPISP
ncbi:MAG: class I SAM-dependent methyltransferase [Thermodesulfobacteriota bacterium]